MAKVSRGVGPNYPQVVVLMGATGDLAKRKLLPGLFHLVNSGFIPGCRIIGVSLESSDVGRIPPTRAPSGQRILDAQGQRCGLGRLLAKPRLCAADRGRRRVLKAAVDEAEQFIGSTRAAACTT